MNEYIYKHMPSGCDVFGKQVDLPTLVKCEEIIRCKDCRYYQSYVYSNFTCELLMFRMETDDFCSQAERKDENE